MIAAAIHHAIARATGRPRAADVLAAAAHYSGWGYATGPDTRYPETLELPACVPSRWIRRGPERRACDCSTLIAGALLAAHQVDDASLYADLLLAHGDAARPWSPVEGLARVTGRPVWSTLPLDGGLLLVQAWRGLDGGRIAGSSRGHSLLVRPLAGTAVQIWESSPRAIYGSPPGVRTLACSTWADLVGERGWDEIRCTPAV